MVAGHSGDPAVQRRQPVDDFPEREFHVFGNTFDFANIEVVAHDRRDGGEQAERGGDQGFGDAIGDGRPGRRRRYPRSRGMHE